MKTVRTDLDSPIWHTVKTAKAHTGVGTRAILDALRAGELKGSQRVANGKWRIHRDDLDAWMRGGS